MQIIINKSAHEKEIAKKLIDICKFDAFEYTDGVLSINDLCRNCLMCVKEGPKGAVSYTEPVKNIEALDKNLWQGICVVGELRKNTIHPVTFELLGKAKELSSVTRHKVAALLMGSNIGKHAKELCSYADEVYYYDYEELSEFLPEPYAATLSDYISRFKPSSILVGATSSGRSLAPRVAARFNTGLTADCTKLMMKEDTDIVQIRPAFGGNIMAEILTSNARPQISTVRAGIFSSGIPDMKKIYEPIRLELDKKLLETKCKIIRSEQKPSFIDISVAKYIVAAGRGVKNSAGLELVNELAELLGAQTACTRPLVENGWFDPRRQIGLSGRTVRPKLIIACGISGSVQFAAGMSGADRIVAINSDPLAKIFNIAHYGVVGDVFEILPRFIALLKDGQ